MYSHTLRAASSSSGLGLFALGRRGGGAAAPGLAVPPRGRSVSATPAGRAPVPGDQGVGMEQPKQQQTQVPPQQQDAGDKNKRDDTHKTTTELGDVMTHSFGEGYSTRCDEEGFGGVYGRYDPVEHPGGRVHPSHPEYDTSQGSEVKEKEKSRHHKGDNADKHATA